jgi:hypothetical protein
MDQGGEIREKGFSNILPLGKAPDEGLDDHIGKVPKEDPRLSTKTIAKTLNISFTTVRNDLTKSLGIKCYHVRWVPHTSTRHNRPNVERWSEACYKRWKAMQPPFSTSCWLAMNSRCCVSTIMNQYGQRRGKKWTNLGGRHIIRGR